MTGVDLTDPGYMTCGELHQILASCETLAVCPTGIRDVNLYMVTNSQTDGDFFYIGNELRNAMTTLSGEMDKQKINLKNMSIPGSLVARDSETLAEMKHSKRKEKRENNLFSLLFHRLPVFGALQYLHHEIEQRKI